MDRRWTLRLAEARIESWLRIHDCFMRSKRSKPKPGEEFAETFVFSSMAWSPPCLRAFARCLLLALAVPTLADCGMSEGSLSAKPLTEGTVRVFDTDGFLILVPLESCSGFFSYLWHMRHSTLTDLVGVPARSSLPCLLERILVLMAFSCTMLVREVLPGIKIVPHALHALLPSTRNGTELSAASELRCSIRCADVAGAITE